MSSLTSSLPIRIVLHGIGSLSPGALVDRSAVGHRGRGNVDDGGSELLSKLDRG
jgi:hypothetical protein